MVAYLAGEPVGWVYPMLCKPGQTVSWGEMNVGARSTFAAAGFRDVTRPTTRRVVMRLDLD